jgi:L-threonylcarbamoyladenylate synthase
VGVESTVLDATAEPMVLYRPGAVSAEQIAAIAGPVVLYQPPVAEQTPQEALPSPGVGIRHYAPRTRLVLAGSAGELQALVRTEAAAGRRAGVLLPSGWEAGEAAAVFDWGPSDRPDTLAQRLFAGLRALDAAGVDVIFCVLPEGDGIARAIRDRLRKAALPRSGAESEP